MGVYKDLFVAYKRLMLDRIADRLGEDRTPESLARLVGSLISDGELAPGEKLPTVRALAGALDISVNTVTDAWRILRLHGVIETNRRQGTTVRAQRGNHGRHWQVPVEPGTIEVDLSAGTPDKELLPPLGPVLEGLHHSIPVTSYVDPPLLAPLELELRRRWPYEVEAVTVVDGALDALDRVVTELVRVGDTVVVEDPTFPPLLDMLDAAGARTIGVGLDAEGIRLDGLRDALDLDPVALFVQPRAHNPTGLHITKNRARGVADLVAGRRCLVIEDDHSGGAAGIAVESAGETLPAQTIHIQSFSKSHGPDLRIAALGGPAEFIERIVRRRQLGPSWTSRLIQQILLALLTDPAIDLLVGKAAAEYSRRRAALVAALAAHGIGVSIGAGLNLWIPVPDEQRAVVALAAHGIGVAPGAPFCVGPGDGPHIRVSIGTLRPADIEWVAATIAVAGDPTTTLRS
ncbi:MAG: DNA-binding transcriptional MocR family regulator [Candidatus Aldehydirespiratoraceae bacterium]|jgi:DNA-binding transcriptional MocR family regulator